MATLFVEELANLDFAYLDPQRGLVGETYLLDLELTGDLDAQGMVLDFGRVKREIRDAAERLVDHKLVVPAQSPAVAYDASVNRVLLTLVAGGMIEVVCPSQALCLIDAGQVGIDTVAAAVREVVRGQVPGNVSDVDVVLRPEQIDGAWYHYRHGLRKHDGDCQRIAHGHRSRIRIERAGRRDEGLERAWAARWNDHFLATGSDELPAQRVAHRRFGYDAPQGHFELELPASLVDILPTDTTVEQLAEFTATTLAGQLGEPVAVRAYEGVRKGARAMASGVAG